MALLTHQWQQPDVDSIARLAMAARAQTLAEEEQKQSVARQAMKQSQDMAFALRQEQRLVQADSIKNDLDAARALRDAELNRARQGEVLARTNKVNAETNGITQSGQNMAGLLSDAPAAPTGFVEPPLPEGGAEESAGVDAAASLLKDANAGQAAMTAAPISLTGDAPATLSLEQPSPFNGAAIPAASDLLGSANASGGSTWNGATSAAPVEQPSGGVVATENPKGFGFVTTYGNKGDRYGGPNAKSTVIGATGKPNPPDALALSPDTEKLLAAQGIKLGDKVTLRLSNGQEVTRTFTDRTAQDDQVLSGKIPGVSKPLRGRFDFISSDGKMDPNSDARVISFRKAGDSASPGAPAAPGAAPILSAEQKRIIAALPPKEQARTVSQLLLQNARAKPAGVSRPIVRNMADGTTQQYDLETKSWNVIAKKAEGEHETIEEATQGMTAVPEHNTYKNADGLEFFANKGANGKVTMRAFRPTADKPAKLLFGSDGNVYPHDSQGNPMKPVPEGVQLRNNSTLQTAKTPGGGTMIVQPDGSLTELIPDGAKLDTKQTDAYVAAASEYREAAADLAAQQKLLAEKPKSLTSWFGGSQSSVDEAQKKVKAAEDKVEQFRTQFPQLRPRGIAAAPAAAPAAPGAPAAKKLDADTARAMLQEAGGDKAKARALAVQRGFTL